MNEENEKVHQQAFEKEVESHSGNWWHHRAIHTWGVFSEWLLSASSCVVRSQNFFNALARPTFSEMRTEYYVLQSQRRKSIRILRNACCYPSYSLQKRRLSQRTSGLVPVPGREVVPGHNLRL